MTLKLKKLFLILILFGSLEVHSKSSNILKLTCEYDPNLIKKKTKDIGFLNNENLDKLQICKFFSCKDTVEVHKFNNKTNDQIEYRLKNSWFNHQGILLDDFLISKNRVTINTFLSQSYFVESYLIDITTGKTKRTFYRFGDPDFFYNIKKIENNTATDQPLFNKNGKLSLKTINSFSLEPWEVFYFEGKCQEGTGL